MRNLLIAGNWKMFTNAATARKLAAAVVQGVGADARVGVVLCPPYPYLLIVAEALRGTKVSLGAQNVYPEKDGAFTGEVSPAMLLDVGCRYVIVGHSERRHVLGESDAFVRRKVQAALAAGLTVILCVGETLQERESDRTKSVLDGQLSSGLEAVTPEAMTRLVLAYEPVWAIGTGRNATPEQAQEVHVFLRRRVADLFGENVARAILIQYGGSVKAENAASLLKQPDVDGALVGGASLVADQFLSIVHAGQNDAGK